MADHTHDKITDIAAPGVVDADTTLALVDALHAPSAWADPFDLVGDHRSRSAAVRCRSP